jgi:predicted neuraminidase
MFGDTFCEGRVLARTSEDAGLSWTSDHPVFDATCVMIRNRPIVLRGGRWLMPAYVEAFYASQFWASDDGGNTWMSGQPMVTLPNNNLQPAVVELADGSLLSLMRADGPDRSTWEGRSHDCGRTWSLQPRPDLPNPDSGLDLLRLSTGELVVAYNPSADQRRPLAVAFSTDDGHTWSAPRLIAEGPPQLSYPSFAAGPDGTIHVVYSDRLTAIGHVAFNRAWLYEAAETTP